jgi:hypothetical protein
MQGMNGQQDDCVIACWQFAMNGAFQPRDRSVDEYGTLVTGAPLNVGKPVPVLQGQRAALPVVFLRKNADADTPQAA